MPNEMMVDLETLGISAKSKITQIGYAIFDEKVTEFDCFHIDPDSYPTGIIEWSTVKWWLKQNDTSRLLLTQNRKTHKTEDALLELKDIYTRFDCKKIWAHGSVFDIAIIREAYKAFDINVPWSYVDVRDTRTLFDLANYDYMHYGDDYDAVHFAETDAIRQSQQVIDAKNKLLGQETDSANSSA